LVIGWTGKGQRSLRRERSSGILRYSIRLSAERVTQDSLNLFWRTETLSIAGIFNFSLKLKFKISPKNIKHNFGYYYMWNFFFETSEFGLLLMKIPIKHLMELCRF
jgi:hypothetical protein